MSEQPPDSSDDDETVIRQSADDDKTRIRESSAEGEVQKGSAIADANEQQTDRADIVAGGPSEDESDNATVIRTPSPREEIQARVVAGGKVDDDGDATTIRADASDDDATVIRSGDDDATVMRPGASDSDVTVIRPDDMVGGDDETVMRPGDGDATIIGAPGSVESDTTYIASVGKQTPQSGNSEAGRLLKNRFVLEEKIGSGGMGDVYKALDLRAQEAKERNPYQAIKLLNENFSRHKDAFQALQREMAKTRGIPHKNIMGVYDFDREGDTVFMNMELLTGMPLDDYLKEHPEGVSVEDAWNIIDGVCQGLSRAHSAGIVHSDFKPGNIFYTEDKTAKVFDFGIARAVSNPNEMVADGEKTVFDAGSLGALTPTYASYEMLKGEEPSKSDDVYAIALVAYELFTGKHPYDRVPADKALERGMQPKRVPFLKGRHWKVLRKGLQLKGEQRTKTVDEFHEGMFSEDPPILRYTALAAVLVASIGFGAYSYFFAQVEEPEELRGYRIALDTNSNALGERLASRDWKSLDWHDQVFTGLDRMRTASKGLSEDWSEEVGQEQIVANTGLIASREQEILKAYLAEIVRLRRLSRGLEDDKQSVEEALAYLTEARGYMDQVRDRNYLVFNPGDVADEVDALNDRIDDREDRLAEIAEATRQKLLADEAQVARLAAKARADQKSAAKVAGYKLHSDNLRKVLVDQCKKNQDIPEQGLVLLGRSLVGMKVAAPDWYARDEENIAKALAGCIAAEIGEANPRRALQVQERVMTFLPGETLISGIVINPKDPCSDRALVGRGNRSRWCEDKLAGEGSGPRLVVVPRLGENGRFAISRTEVKIEDYNQYCDRQGCKKLDAGDPSLPATNLSVEDARGYVQWLSKLSGKVYRLPTVAEWTWAVKTDKYEGAGYDVNCTVDSRGVRLGEKLKQVLSGRPNRWGLYNPIGNAREWAEDGKALVTLGGAHTNSMSDCRDLEIYVGVTHSGEADPITGFRVLRQITSS